MKDTCPKCGNETLGFGYGLAGGGIGPYSYCEAEGCDYFDKSQDPEIGDHPTPPSFVHTSSADCECKPDLDYDPDADVLWVPKICRCSGRA